MKTIRQEIAEIKAELNEASENYHIEGNDIYVESLNDHLVVLYQLEEDYNN